ncbi:GntR family transcriptional regulator [Lactococcus garvieae]|jgi:DNA-binding GntR family transcriptional regulator|uniref:GntR family transcriptional regulator n=1 Tax=Lactococcus garvieae TaxID=1363 RepID=UPI00324DFEE5
MKKKQPKYLVIYEDVKEKILSGYYPINSRIADGNTLVQEYDASLMTVKKALDILVSEGFLIRRRGYGTIVKDWTKGKKAHLYAIEGSSKRHLGQLESEVLTFEVEHPNADIAHKLSIDVEDFIYRIERVRYVKKVPTIIEYTYMPISIIPQLKYSHLTGSIYKYILEELGLVIQSSFLNVKGVRPNALEKQTMHLTDTDFLMQVEQVANLDDGRIFEYSIARHLPDSFNFETVIFNN